MSETKIVFILVVFNSRGVQVERREYATAAKAAAEWMMRVAQGWRAELSNGLSAE